MSYLVAHPGDRFSRDVAQNKSRGFLPSSSNLTEEGSEGRQSDITGEF